MTIRLNFCALALSLVPLGAAAVDKTVEMHRVDGTGVRGPVGSVTISESRYGLVFTPALSRLTPGVHGFHVHEKPSCEAHEKDGKKVAALGAGGHYDPSKSGRHGTPWGDGHLGDLPPLLVEANGDASRPVLAPRLKMADLKGRSLMIHAGADNHADDPEPLGGGGARIACGVID